MTVLSSGKHMPFPQNDVTKVLVPKINLRHDLGVKKDEDTVVNVKDVEPVLILVLANCSIPHILQRRRRHLQRHHET
jgi:hypothetical protein